MTRQITRELIIEKLLSLIDLPIIEHLLTIDEKHDVDRAVVSEAVSVTVAGLEADAITGNEGLFTRIRDERRGAFEHVDELVFVRMPVALARPIARR